MPAGADAASRLRRALPVSALPATVQPMNRTYEFPTFNRLESAYVTLEPLDITHAIGIWHAVQDEPDALFEHLFFGPFDSLHAVNQWIVGNIERTDQVPIAIFSKRLEAYVGTCALINIDTANGSAEIGSIWCSTALHGTEVIAATAQLLLDHLFESLGYRRVVWKCDTTNYASRKAAERMGFSYEGTFRKHMYVRGRSRDTAWYAIIDSDWPEAKEQLALRLVQKTQGVGADPATVDGVE